MAEIRGNASFYNIPYGIASAALTGGLNAIATTGGVYHGVRIIATTADCTAIVYDSASTTAGNVLDIIFVDSSASLVATSDLNVPVLAKNGITIGVSEAGAKGVIFFGPKG